MLRLDLLIIDINFVDRKQLWGIFIWLLQRTEGQRYG
jgi:hypothetical protein